MPPAACTAKATPAKTKNDANTPAPYTKPSVRTRRGSSLACCTNPNTFSAKTGSTHGITLRMSPPTKAESSLISNSAMETGSGRAVERSANGATMGTLNSTGSAAGSAAGSAPFATSNPSNRSGHPESPTGTVLRMRRNPFCGSRYSVLIDTGATPPTASKGNTSNPETPDPGFQEITSLRGTTPSEASQTARMGRS